MTGIGPGNGTGRRVEPFVKKAFFVAFAVLLVVLGTLLVAPVFVDWNTYRADVAAAMARVTGRKVTIAGDLNLTLLPLPRLTARQIGVASIDGATEPEMLGIGELRMELALAPLITGRFAVRSLALIDPVLTLETTAGGRENWSFDAVGRGDLPNHLASAVSVESISIANGRLVWRTAGTAPGPLEAVDATVSIGRSTSVSRVQAHAVYKGVPVRLVANIGRFERDGMAAVSAAVELGGGTGAVAASGRLSSDLRSASGTVQLTAADAERLGRLLAGGTGPALPPWKITADSTFTIGRDTVTLHDIAATYGGIRGTGHARLVLGKVPAVEAELVVGALKVDDLIGALEGRDPPSGRIGSQDPAWQWGGPVRAFSADLEVSVRAARWRGGVIRNIGATLHLGPEGTAIERLAITLPGGTDVTLSAAATSGGSSPRWDGDLAVISDNLRGALVWAGTAADELPSDRLRSFSFTSRIGVTPDAVHLTNIGARLDATRMTGAATIARQARPSFGLRLDLDQLELDAYVPEWLRAGRVDDSTRGDGIGAAGRFDANLVISVGKLTVAGRTASRVALDARLFDGKVLLRRLSADDLAGGALTVSGTIDDLASSPSGDLEILLEVDDPDRFAGFMELAPSSLVSRVGKFRLSAHALGTLEKAVVAGTLDIAGGRLAAQGTVTRPAGAVGFDFAVAADHPDADTVLGLLAPGRARGGIGAMALTLAVSGTADALAIRDVEAALGETEIRGRIDVDNRGDRPSAVAALAAGRLDLDRLLPVRAMAPADAVPPVRRGSARWSRETLDLSTLHMLDLDLTLQSDTVLRDGIRINGLELRTALSNGALTVRQLTGRLFGGDIEASARIDATAARPVITATLSGRDIAAGPALEAIAAIDRVKGTMSFSVSLSATGRDTFDLVSSLSGNATLSGTLRAQRRGDEPIPAGAAGDAADMLLKTFADSTTALSAAVAIESGTVRTADLVLDGGAVRALTLASVDLSGWRVNATTTVHRSEDSAAPPDLVVEIDGWLDDPAVRLSGLAVETDPDQAPAPEAAPVIAVEPVAPTAADLPGSP